MDWLEPETDGRYHSNVPIAFGLSISDTEDLTEELTIAWSSSIDGTLERLPTNADSSGSVIGLQELSEGTHNIVVSVSDTTNKTTTIEQELVVYPLIAYLTVR